MRKFSADQFELNLVGVLDNRSPLSATMHETTISMLYDGHEVGSMKMPEQSLPAGGELKLNVTQTATVSKGQKAAFDKFSKALLAEKTLTLGMQACRA